MKKNKLFSALAVLTTAGMFFGCYNGTDLTKTFDKAAEYNDKAVVNFKAPTNCSISVTSSDKLQANKSDSEVVVTFTSDFYLDEKTLNAVSFFGITESENNYPTETALTSSVKEVTKSNSDPDKVITIVTYTVDLTSYNKKKIGAKVDATVLKDVNKNYVLNGNENEKAGEATDSMYIGVISVKPNKNGDAFTETLTVTVGDLKPFAPTILDYTTFSFTTIGDVQNLVVTGWYEDYAETTRNSSSAASLSSIFKVQTILPGESKWVDTPVTFVWAETQYVAPVVMALAPAGTKYRVVVTSDPSVTFKAAGMDVPMTYTSSKLYYDLGSGVSSYYLSDTTTIVRTTTMPVPGTNAYPDTVQKNFATVTKTPLTLAGYGAKFTINFNFNAIKDGAATTDIGLSAADDFIVTTKGEYGYKKVPATVEAVKNDDGIITKVIVKTEESKKTNYLADDLLVWAGSGVTITRNDKNAAQTHFGTALDFVKRDASGYVQLN